MLKLEKYSIGTGDRFGRQAGAQLRACMLALSEGIEVVPVWNKSNREHNLIGSEPSSVRAAAERAVCELGWDRPWHVDADHINIDTVERFIEPSDFFTIDVADFIGKPPELSELDEFVKRHGELIGREATADSIRAIGCRFLCATREAGRIYRHIANRKGADNFITEVSMDETDREQTPLELLVILAALADEGIPLQTIAPRFVGRFNKGVDYVGDADVFAREFRNNLAVVDFAIGQYGLPETLKLSVHTGSDKLSIYGAIGQAIAETGSGLHLKTAGTSWLEEMAGLAEVGGEGLAAVKEIYREAWGQQEMLCGPYATVIDIEFSKLPDPDTVDGWDSDRMTAALRRDANVRQLMHVAFRIAAKMGPRYLRLLDEYEPVIARNVTGNLLDRHIRAIWKWR